MGEGRATTGAKSPPPFNGRCGASSRSERYTYIPTIDVLRALRKEGFEPFMVAQSKSRIEGKTEFTKHMIRIRHSPGSGGAVSTRPEVNEIILINSHDGASCYQMMAGAFRFICHSGLVVGKVSNDIRLPHKGDISHDVIEGARDTWREIEPGLLHIAQLVAGPLPSTGGGEAGGTGSAASAAIVLPTDPTVPADAGVTSLLPQACVQQEARHGAAA